MSGTDKIRVRLYNVHQGAAKIGRVWIKGIGMIRSGAHKLGLGLDQGS